MTTLDRVAEFALRPVPARMAGYARVAVGLAAVGAAFDTGIILRRVLVDGILPLPLAPGLPVLPAAWLNGLLALWVAAGVAFLVGWRTTAAGVVLAAVMTYVTLVSQQSYSNHLYLLVWEVGLLTAAGAGAAVSLDARGSAAGTVRASPVFLLKVQLTVLYGFAAVTKINPEYLSGAVLAGAMRWDGPLALPAGLRTPALLSLAAFASVAAEALLAVVLWSPRWRKAGAALGVALHLGMAAMIPFSELSDILVFATSAIGLYPLFFDDRPASGGGKKPASASYTFWSRLSRSTKPR